MTDEPPFSIVADPASVRAAANALFHRIARELQLLLPSSADIRHVGATAIAGCLTKGDLDIVVRVDPDDFAAADAALATNFNRNSGSARTDDFSSFEAPAEEPPLGIQLTIKGGECDDFHRFAALLLARPDLVARYNELKRGCEGMAMDEYRAAKSAFIAEVLLEAGTEN